MNTDTGFLIRVSDRTHLLFVHAPSGVWTCEEHFDGRGASVSSSVRPWDLADGIAWAKRAGTRAFRRDGGAWRSMDLDAAIAAMDAE